MIKTANKQKDNTGASIRRRLSAAICMLLIATIMLVTSTYAWFTLSTSPEVRGINTSVAGNGSLEIALMPTNGQFSGITSGRGASGTEYGGAREMTVANLSWGNVVNLKDQSYGLDLITLNPVEFNIGWVDQEVPVYQTNPETGEIVYDDETGEPIPEYEEDGETPKTETKRVPDGTIDEVPFSRPAYGYDGRITELKAAQLKAKADGEGFDSDNYGVRAIVDENGSTYGYVVDLALRLNTVAAADAETTTNGKLLLQTQAAQRVYSDSTAAATQGGGSNLWFQDEEGNDVSDAAQLEASNYLKAIKIAFVQNFGNAANSNATVLCYARADINTGDLYLCDYYGEALANENVILDSMIKNQAYQISVVVWLDGTAVTNANMAINNAALSKATLNLQFATDVELVPANNANLKNNPPEPVAPETEVEAETTTETDAEPETTTETDAEPETTTETEAEPEP